MSRPKFISVLRQVIGWLLLVSLTGCGTLSYYYQAISGQMHLLVNRRGLDRVLLSESVNPALKERIVLARRITEFAERELGLPVGNTFSSYVDVGSPYLLWNVFAAPEFSLTLKTFCYPIAGCVSYKGYFSAESAAKFSATLADQGLDTFSGGVAAYSTLGWFADPLLNTYIDRNDTQLAALIFHELAHRVVYIPGDTRFNESFATAVEQAALRRWLQVDKASAALEDYQLTERHRSQVLTLIAEARTELETVYNSAETDKVKREQKMQVIASLKADYWALAANWNSGQVFADWMASDINNAMLGAVADYNDWVEYFEIWLASLDGDLPVFFRGVKQLANLDDAERILFLNRLTGQRIPE